MYPLYAFTDGRHIIVTRGSTPEKAFRHAMRSSNWPRGVTVWQLDYCMVSWKDQYTSTHPFNWLDQAPKYESQ